MAILDLLGVELRAGGKTLPEYDGIDQQENPPPRMTTKYVRVPAGRIFQIRVSVSEHYQFNSEGLEFQILIDGRIYETFLILKEQHPGGSADLAGVEVQGSDGVVKLRPLRFSNVNFVKAGENFASGTISFEEFRHFGSITVRVSEITNCKETDSDGAYEDYDVDPIKAHKDELPKGVTQSVVLGRPRRLSDNPNFYSNEYINEDTSIATFELKYRTKEALNLILHPPDNLENRPFEDYIMGELNLVTSRMQTLSIDADFKTPMRQMSIRSNIIQHLSEGTSSRRRAHPCRLPDAHPITRTTRAHFSILVPIRGSPENLIFPILRATGSSTPSSLKQPSKPPISSPQDPQTQTNPPSPQKSSPTSSPHAPRHRQIHPTRSLNLVKKQADTNLTLVLDPRLHPSSHRACP